MIRFDCRHFRGSRPCDFNKVDGSECPSCTHYSPYDDRILFIKLDALGDVLRSASLLPAIIARHKRPYIAWLTRSDAIELVDMMTLVDETIALSEDVLARIGAGAWTAVYSLSNDLTSASLAAHASSRCSVVGFTMQDGVIRPSNAAAERWLQMAAFDRLKMENALTYQEHMLAIIDSGGPIAAPSLRVSDALRARAAHRLATTFSRSPRQRIAVNVGAGKRWPKKMLDLESTTRVILSILQRADVDVMLVGGASEEQQVQELLARCDAGTRLANFLTQGSPAEFVATMMQAHALLCGDTFALHVATAIGLPTVCVFGPTSRSEIADYGGLVEKIWAPSLDCLGCYGDCAKVVNCMTALDADELAARIVARLPRH